MSRQYPTAPVVGVGAIVIVDDRVMLVRRGNPPAQGEWSIPGGLVELGESVREAVIREVREETGLTITPTLLLGTYDRVLKDEDGRVLYHYVLIDFLCRRISGEMLAADDAADARWFKREELTSASLHEDTFAVIELGFENGTENTVRT